MPYIEGGEFSDKLQQNISGFQDILMMIEDFRSRLQEAIDSMEEWQSEYGD